ncbi:hypothetical protein HYPSUDRAFT_56726 [Hypholoma sublateritium FD-334 SS-4]|uniref:Uncharacterized protein n=1 Tax=Hypholoma sublateritium (strain FD-334 SS-4) TaxID=945553 RepID=A0A0D2NJZ9_HYPSF|nr:hypothetical protein HYPSUDRAFT_56726 [Hypholoma sublateritium FD-334 SS-4]
MNGFGLSAARTKSSYELQMLVPRALSSVHDTTSRTTSTAVLPSSLSTPTSSSADPDAEDSVMHSPVPMVAGALAGFIAILAAVITVIVLRRKKQRAMSRGAVIHSSTIGSTAAFDSEYLPPTSRRSAAGMGNPFVAPISAQLATSKKRGSRQYDSMAEDMELTHRGSHGEYIPQLAHDEFRARDDHTQRVQVSYDLRGNRRYSRQRSQVGGSSDRPDLSTVFGMHANTTRTGEHELYELPPSNSDATSAPALVRDRPDTIIPSPSGSTGIRPVLDSFVLDTQPISTNPARIPTSRVDRGGDLPPAYEDVR